MELKITELEYDAENVFGYDAENVFGYNQEPTQTSFKDIPENNVKIKVNKKGVHFEENIRPINQTIPKENAKMVRPKVSSVKPQISYEDIMSKMGMFVADGKLHLMDNNPQGYEQIKQYQNNQQKNSQQQYNQQKNSQQKNNNIPQNSYIYNKFFKEELKPQNEVRGPMTPQQYKRYVLENFIQRQRIKEMKSRKLLMPTTNINMASGNSANLNKLFNFSKR